MELRGYEIGKCIGEAEKFRLYLASKVSFSSQKAAEPAGGEQNLSGQVQEMALFKVAKTFEDGDQLSAEARQFNLLRFFAERCARIEKESGLDWKARHDLLFARLEDSFMEPTQDDRRINIFSFPETSLDKLTPLSKLAQEVEIDARSSVWIIGRLFKFYQMFELVADDDDNSVVPYPLFSPDDYFVGPERHRVIYCNYSGTKNDLSANNFVKAIARFMLGWLAFSSEDCPTDEQKYRILLEEFAQIGRPDFDLAHQDLYALVRQLWGIQYHPFTYRTRGTKLWETIQEG